MSIYDPELNMGEDKLVLYISVVKAEFVNWYLHCNLLYSQMWSWCTYTNWSFWGHSFSVRRFTFSKGCFCSLLQFLQSSNTKCWDTKCHNVILLLFQRLASTEDANTYSDIEHHTFVSWNSYKNLSNIDSTYNIKKCHYTKPDFGIK